MDSGTNYYAVQTYSNAPDDRRIQIAWMNGSNFPDMPFNQQMSFPRELTLHRVDKGYVLKSMPVNELALLYGRKYIWKSLVVEEKNCFTTKLNTPAFYLKTGFAVDSVDAQILAFDINGLNLIYDSVKQILTVEKENGETLKQMVLKPNEGRIELDILSDMMKRVAEKNISPDEKLLEMIYTRLDAVKEVVYRNGTLRAYFFRDIWRVEKVRKKFDAKEIQIFKAVLLEGQAKGVFHIDDVEMTADLIHYCVKGIEVPYIRGHIGAHLDEDTRNRYVSNIVFGALHRTEI